MMRTTRLSSVCSAILLATFALGCAVKIQPPASPTPRTLDPRLPAEDLQPTETSPNALQVRLQDVRSSLPVQYSLLRRSSNGELTEDGTWSWSTPPAALLGRALRLTAAADPAIEIVDRSGVTTVAATLVTLHLESETTELVGAVELRITRQDRSVRTEVLSDRATVSRDLPGNLADETGRLVTRLATMCWEVVKRGG